MQSHSDKHACDKFLSEEPRMDILSALKSEASKLQKQLNSINSAIEILGGKNSVGRVKRGKKRRLSASARARIAKAQRARWAKVRAAKR